MVKIEKGKMPVLECQVLEMAVARDVEKYTIFLGESAESLEKEDKLKELAQSEREELSKMAGGNVVLIDYLKLADNMTADRVSNTLFSADSVEDGDMRPYDCVSMAEMVRIYATRDGRAFSPNEIEHLKEMTRRYMMLSAEKAGAFYLRFHFNDGSEDELYYDSASAFVTTELSFEERRQRELAQSAGASFYAGILGNFFGR